MKTNPKRRAATALALASYALLGAALVGCGSNSGSSSPAVLPGSVVGTSGITGGCIPISEPIVFQASSVASNGGGGFALGTIPSGPSYGAVTVGTGSSLVSTGAITYTDTMQPSASAPAGEASGTLELSFSSLISSGYYNQNYYNLNTNTSNTVYGYMQLSELAQESIATSPYLEEYLQGSNYNGYYGSQNYNYNNTNLCVSGIAMEGYLYGAAGNGGFQATVWLYLNNTSNGYILYWE